MIWESSYWKKPLLRASTKITELSQTPNPSDDDLGNLEYLAMNGFYAIRKLLEAETKLSRTTSEGHYRSKRYPLRQEHAESKKYPDRIFNKSPNHYYDLANPIQASSNLAYICNQFIHSYVFVFSTDAKGQLDDIFLSSDRDRKTHCNYISLKEVSRIFKIVGEDYPTDALLVRNGDGDWKVLM